MSICRSLTRTSIGFALLASIVSGCLPVESNGQNDAAELAPMADWPAREAAVLVEEANFIAYGEVKDTAEIEKQIHEDEPSVQTHSSTMEIIHVFKGKESAVITVHQYDQVMEAGERYVVFLSEQDGEFAQLDAKSFVPEEDGVLVSQIPGLTKRFDGIDEFKRRFEELTN